MVHAIVRLRDGFPTSREWLRSVVSNIQGGLIESDLDVQYDGRFGPRTESALREFQEQVDVPVTGIADKLTWGRLERAVITAVGQRQPYVAEQLPTFRGDLHWIHDREGHKGQPYWPAGASGVTLDPGVDLGHANPGLVEHLYRNQLNDIQYAAVTRVLGVTGTEAATALQNDDDLKSIRVTREQAERLLPFAARPYWKAVCRRFSVEPATTIPAVQTVLLSLAYNRGAGNPHLKELAAPLHTRQWAAVADLVGLMQQQHILPGIVRRRQYEANLIRAELEYLSS